MKGEWKNLIQCLGVSRSSELQATLLQELRRLEKGHAQRTLTRFQHSLQAPWPSRHCGGTPTPVCFSLTTSSCHSSLGPPRSWNLLCLGTHTPRDPYPGLMGWDPLPVVGWLSFTISILPGFIKTSSQPSPMAFSKAVEKKRERVRSGD